MFHGDADLSSKGTYKYCNHCNFIVILLQLLYYFLLLIFSSKGPLAVAVPGEIKGYYKAKELFGNPSVSWESLIRPSINLAREGIPVTFSKGMHVNYCIYCISITFLLQ